MTKFWSSCQRISRFQPTVRLIAYRFVVFTLYFYENSGNKKVKVPHMTVEVMWGNMAYCRAGRKPLLFGGLDADLGFWS